MKIEYSSSKINNDVKRKLSKAREKFQSAADYFYWNNYPSGFILSYVNNPLSECYDHKNEINRIISWLDNSEQTINNMLKEVENNLNSIKGYSVKRRESSIK